MELFLAELIVKYPIVGSILAVVGALVFIAQIVILATPGKKDDQWLEEKKKNSYFTKVWNFFLSFAPAQKGAKGLELSNTNLEKK